MIHFQTGELPRKRQREACVGNHLAWLRRLADASGGQVNVAGELEWALTWLPTSEATVPVVSPPLAPTLAALEEIIATCRRDGVSLLGVWAGDEAYSDTLTPWLEARGIRRRGQPWWMALDLHSLPEPRSYDQLTSIVDMSTPARFDGWSIPELNCFNPDTRAAWQAMAAARPQRVWHTIIWQDGQPVGQVSVNVTEGQLGVAGLHNFVILPKARIRGPGLDRFDWITRFCLDLGARYAVANALERAVPLYRAMGFQEVGRGQTWWATRALLDHQPEPWQVGLAEAVGRGDVEAVRSIVTTDPQRADRPLLNGMTPLRYAGHTNRPAVARWLLSHGAAPDLIAAWDLGWREEAYRLLSDGAADLLAWRSRSGKTLLHVGVERGDADLIRLLLAGGADPGVPDERFGMTPLELAVVMRRREIAGLLRDPTG